MLHWKERTTIIGGTFYYALYPSSSLQKRNFYFSLIEKKIHDVIIENELWPGIISRINFVAESAPPIRAIVETVSLGSVQFIFNCINWFQREKMVDSAATMMTRAFPACVEKLINLYIIYRLILKWKISLLHSQRYIFGRNCPIIDTSV